MAVKHAQRGLGREYNNSYLQLRDDLHEMARCKEAAGLNENPQEAWARKHQIRKERKNHPLQRTWLKRAWM